MALTDKDLVVFNTENQTFFQEQLVYYETVEAEAIKRQEFFKTKIAKTSEARVALNSLQAKITQLSTTKPAGTVTVAPAPLPAAAPEIQAVMIADTKKMLPLTDGYRVPLNFFQSYDILAFGGTDFGSGAEVRFYLDNALTTTEQNGPYTMSGSVYKPALPTWVPTKGLHTLRVVAMRAGAILKNGAATKTVTLELV